VVDLDVVRDNYHSFAKALPDSRVEHAAVRQRLGKALIVVAHDVEVDHEAWLGVEALAAAVAQEFPDAFGHSTLQTALCDKDPFKLFSAVGALALSHDGDATRPRTPEPNCAAVDWLGNFPPAHLAMKDKPFQ
jgi:hypothetical protein